MLAAGAMALSSVLVVLNALRLRRFAGMRRAPVQFLRSRSLIGDDHDHADPLPRQHPLRGLRKARRTVIGKADPKAAVSVTSRAAR